MTAKDILIKALPLIRRAATEEARANLAPRGLPKQYAMQKLLKLAEGVVESRTPMSAKGGKGS